VKKLKLEKYSNDILDKQYKKKTKLHKEYNQQIQDCENDRKAILEKIKKIENNKKATEKKLKYREQEHALKINIDELTNTRNTIKNELSTIGADIQTILDIINKISDGTIHKKVIKYIAPRFCLNK